MSFPEDKSNYEQAILEFPEQFDKGIELARDVKIDGTFSSAAICGMGASSMAAELLSEVASGTKPIRGVRQYYLPREIIEDTLIITSSYSGNTEETLVCYDIAKQQNLKMIGVSQNGKLLEKCQEDSTPFVKYPDMPTGFQPRWAFGLSFATLGRLLENHDIMPGFTEELASGTSSLKMDETRKQGEKNAEKLYKKEPAIYGPQKFAYLARLWQIDLNEDAKVPASWNSFPEANHYETTGYTQGFGNRIAVMIRDVDDSSHIPERMEITAKLLKEKGVDTVFVDIRSGQGNDGTIAAILQGTLLCMWTCYYLAKMYKIDPAPTEMVEKLKKRLS